MAHLFQAAPTGRSKCRGCGQLISRGAIRFGERLPNPFADGDMTLWFHPACAAFKRPQSLLEALAGEVEVDGREALESAARAALAHPRLARIDGAERARTGQAACRSCRQPIGRGTWRIRLVYYDEGRFSPAGYVHLDCRRTYFETEDVLAHALHFSTTLSDEDREGLRVACSGRGED